MLCSSRILVGAPQAAGQGPLRGSRPGALFRCPITPEEYDCERVDIDGEGAWKSRDDKFISGENNPINTARGFTNGFGFYAYFLNSLLCFTSVSLSRESKHNQWLGVTVKSQGIGGKVVVSEEHQLMKPSGQQTLSFNMKVTKLCHFVSHKTCAHLYELRQRVSQPSETRDPIGRCYVLSEDLTERDDLDGGEWKFCEGRPQGHEQFGFCQQGLSVSFTPDNNFILFGAPGTYNWKGNESHWTAGS